MRSFLLPTLYAFWHPRLDIVCRADVNLSTHRPVILDDYIFQSSSCQHGYDYV